jgi:sn-glycerol 3-phosphate transport system ATP-binding protein
VADREAKLQRVAELLGLEKLLARKPSQLSGGQQQRVALGRAIVAEAAVCLMDEPLSNLDAQLRGEMRREIRALQRRLGMTMVYVTHDQTEAMTMADRVVLLRGGRIEQVGTPEELYRTPATAFTASFIGAPPMNLIRREGATVGVRPEDMRLGDTGLDARVETVEYLGADSLVALTSQQQPILVRVPGKSRAQAGDTVKVSWDSRHEHHFDAVTGGRQR